MIGEIITVGTELLIGSITNTNSRYISEKLMEIGVNTKYHTTVGDDFKDLEEVISIALDRSDIIILSGGLGPTEDDMTKEALAHVLKREVVENSMEREKLVSYFETRGVEMTPNNLKQVKVIEDSVVLDNDNGTAPGEFIEYEGKKIFLLPGPPRELEPMISKYLATHIFEENNIQIKSYNIIELGESRIEDRLRRLNIAEEGLSINTFASLGQVEIKVLASGKDAAESQSKIEKIDPILREEFGQYLINGYDSMAEALIDIFFKKSQCITFAESITGGLIASTITAHEGASEILKNSYVTYSNEAKMALLGVDEKTLEEYGAVSRECAFEMAKGAKENGICSLSVSVTGEAGPIPSEDKPVGRVYACYYENEDKYSIEEYNFSGNRRDIQLRTVNKVLTHLLLNHKE